MTKKTTKPVAQDDDFLTQEFDPTDAPVIPAASLPFFQFNSGAEVFEFPLAITDFSHR